MAFKVLWVDDNIEELRSHLLYLTEKGFEVEGVTNGQDALAVLRQKDFDGILLDEMMPGMGGLETLEEMRKLDRHVPVIMITKSEAEDLMTRAIGKRINDYLVKPVSPIQVLSALRRQLEARKLASEEVTRDYMSNFMAVTDRIATAVKPRDWEAIYSDPRQPGAWTSSSSATTGCWRPWTSRCSAANQAFGKYVREHYQEWISADGPTGVGGNGKRTGDVPLFSPRVYETWIEPEVQQDKQVIWIVIDCMRLDQMRMIEPLLEPYFHLERRHYWSILPTATPYARNALFAGLYPDEIARRYPQWWISAARATRAAATPARPNCSRPSCSA